MLLNEKYEQLSWLTGSGFTKYLMEKILDLLSSTGMTSVTGGGLSADNGWWYNDPDLRVPQVSMYTEDASRGDAYMHYHHTFGRDLTQTVL